MLLFVALAGAPGCASEVIPTYGDPAQVAGGVGGGVTTTGPGGSGGNSTTSSTSTECVPDPECDVSFAEDVFPVLDTKGGCAAASPCHQSGAKGLTLTPGDVASYYQALTSYTLDSPAEPYIAPCDPAGSTILCNLQLSDGSESEFGKCGTLMPYTPAGSPTPAELDLIKDWIACGAPNN